LALCDLVLHAHLLHLRLEGIGRLLRLRSIAAALLMDSSIIFMIAARCVRPVFETTPMSRILYSLLCGSIVCISETSCCDSYSRCKMPIELLAVNVQLSGV
jgi:hypothetical protein